MDPGQVPYAIALWLIGQPFVVQAIVNWLKVNPWVKRNPRTTAMLLNLAGAVVGEALFQQLPGDLRAALVTLVAAVTQGFASSGIHEWIDFKPSPAPTPLPPR